MLFIKELLFITFLLNVINIVTAMEIIYGQRFSNNQFHIYVNKHGQKCECDIYNNYGDQIDFNGHNPFCC